MKPGIKAKALLFVLFLSFSSIASADRSVSDLVGLPSKGKWWSTVGLSWSQLEFNTTAGTLAFDSEATSLQLNATTMYGVGEKLALGVDINYLLSQEVETTGDVTSSQDSDGIIDPTLRLAYRFLEQSDSGFTLDLQTFVTPGLITAQRAENNTDGNAGEGATTIGLGLDFGHKKEVNEFAATIGFIYETSGESESASDSNDITETESELSFVIGGSFKTKLTPQWAFQVAELITINGEQESTDNSGTVTTIDGGVTFATAVGWQYHFVEDKQLVAFDIVYQLLTDLDATQGATALEIKDANQISFLLNYLVEY